jgi:hypothetical protein
MLSCARWCSMAGILCVQDCSGHSRRSLARRQATDVLPNRRSDCSTMPPRDDQQASCRRRQTAAATRGCESRAPEGASPVLLPAHSGYPGPRMMGDYLGSRVIRGRRLGARIFLAQRRVGLLSYPGQFRDALAAIDEHHREIADHAARVMTTTPLLDRTQPQRQHFVSPTLSATCATSALPACDTKPAPSDVTSTVTGRPSCITIKVNPPSSD